MLTNQFLTPLLVAMLSITINAQTFPSTVTLSEGGPIFEYSLNGTHLSARATFNSVVGWCAVGFGPGTMIGSEAVIGQVSTGDVGVVQYSLTAQDESGVLPSASNSVTGGSIATTDSASVLEFTIPLVFGQIRVLPDQLNNVVWAWGRGDLSYHRERGVDSITLDMNPVDSNTNTTAITEPSLNYSHTIELESGPTFEYTLNATHLIARATLQKNAGWMGIGFGPGTMVGSNAVIGQNSTGDVGVVQYTLTEQDDSGVLPSATNGVTEGAISVSDGVAVLTFTIPLAFGRIEILPDADNNIIWAWGRGDLSYHRDRGVQNIKLQSSNDGITAEPTADATVGTPDITAPQMIYENTVELESGPVFHYTLNATHLTGRAILEESVGWMGIGFGPGTMIGSDAIIGQNSTGDVGVVQYTLTEQDESGVLPSAANGVTGGSITANDSTSILAFTVPLALGQVVILPNEDNHIIWAWGRGDLSYHRDRGVQTVDLKSNSVEGSERAVSSIPESTATAPAAMVDPSPTDDSGDIAAQLGDCGSSDPDYTNEIALNPSVSLAFNVNDGDQTLDILATVSQTVGWIGIGFRSEADGLMVPTQNSVIGQMANNLVTSFALTGRSESDVKQSDANSVTKAEISQTNVGTTIMRFTVPQSIVPGLLEGTDSYLIWAYGDSDTVAYHGQNRGSNTINLATCAASSTTSSVNRGALYAHGIMMVLAWLVFIPLAIFSSAFRPVFATLGSKYSAWWFHSHRILNTLGLLLSTIAFGLAFLLVPAGLDFTDPHHIIGLTVMIVAWLQPLNAFIRPHVPEEGKSKSILRTIWEYTHKGLGYSALILAVVNCYLGLDLAFAADWLYIVYGVWVGVAAASYLLLFVKFNFFSSSAQSEVNPISMSKASADSKKTVVSDEQGETVTGAILV